MTIPASEVNMVYGIGNDIIEVERIRKAYEKTHDIHHVYTENEKSMFEKRFDSVLVAAGNFAAKEAVAKAFGTGFDKNIKAIEIEILRNDMGAPYVTLHGLTKEYADKCGIKKIFISISNIKEMVAAFAVIEV